MYKYIAAVMYDVKIADVEWKWKAARKKMQIEREKEKDLQEVYELVDLILI